MILLAILLGCFIGPIVADETVVQANFKMGGFSVYDPASDSWFIADMFNHSFGRIAPNNHVYNVYLDTDDVTSAITPVANQRNRYYVSLGNRVVEYEWDSYSPTAQEIRTVITGPPDTIFSSLLVTENGIHYIGVFSQNFCAVEPSFALYKYDPFNGLTAVADGFYGVYGLAADENRNIIYVTDPCTGVYAADFNPITGDVSNRRLVLDYHSDDTSLPVGLALDYTGFLITTIYEKAVVRFNPSTGEIVGAYTLPTPFVTIPSLGGRSGNTMLVASGTQEYDFFANAAGPVEDKPAGDVFLVTGFAQGAPPRQPYSYI